MVLSMVKKPNSATGGHSNAHTPRPGHEVTPHDDLGVTVWE